MTISTLKGKWINIRNLERYNNLGIVVFESEGLGYYELEESEESFILKQKNIKFHFEEYSKIHFDCVDTNLIRIFRMGKQIKNVRNDFMLGDNNFYEIDYAHLIPTKIKVSNKILQYLKYKFEWNENQNVLVFNKEIDTKTIQRIDKQLTASGKKVILERIDDTLLVSLFVGKKRKWILLIKELYDDNVILYGLSERPHQIDIQSIPKRN